MIKAYVTSTQIALEKERIKKQKLVFCFLSKEAMDDTAGALH
jgi:hypothetical protein